MRTIAFVTCGAIPPLAEACPTRGIVRGQANPVQTHIGHVMESFQAAPNQQGPPANRPGRSENRHDARRAGTKNPDNLDAIKLHAGHVLNALDPAIEATGPGQASASRKRRPASRSTSSWRRRVPEPACRHGLRHACAAGQ